MTLPSDASLLGWILVAGTGHLECGAWSFDSRNGELACACGEVVVTAAIPEAVSHE